MDEEELIRVLKSPLIAQRHGLVNIMSEICEKLGVDVGNVIDVVKGFPDVGTSDLRSPMGFGSTDCEKNIKFLVETCQKMELPEVAEYWLGIVQFNERHTKKFVQKILKTFYYILSGKNFAICGFAHDGNGDVGTKSLTGQICKILSEEGVTLHIYDPKLIDFHKTKEFEALSLTDDWILNANFYNNPYDAFKVADAIIFCMDYEEFKTLDFKTIYRNSKKPAYIFDGCHFLPHKELRDLGFIVKTTGSSL